jgi:hypothetical protein
MPNIDYGTWGAKAGINPPGGFVGPILASAATLVPTHPIHHVSGAVAISAITPPWVGFVGELTLIADGAWTMATGGAAGSDIGSALTAMTAGSCLKLVYDGTTWYPVR